MQDLKLHNMQQINIISLPRAVSVAFIGWHRILYVFASPITRSICTLLLAIFLSLARDLGENLFLCFRNIGILILTSTGWAKKSNPLAFFANILVKNKNFQIKFSRLKGSSYLRLMAKFHVKFSNRKKSYTIFCESTPCFLMTQKPVTL